MYSTQFQYNKIIEAISIQPPNSEDVLAYGHNGINYAVLWCSNVEAISRVRRSFGLGQENSEDA